RTHAAATIPLFILSLFDFSSLAIGHAAAQSRGERRPPRRVQMAADLELAPPTTQQHPQVQTGSLLVQTQPTQAELVALESPGVARFHQEPVSGDGNALVVRRMPAVRVERGGEREHLDPSKRQDGPGSEAREADRYTEGGAHGKSEHPQQVP